MVVVVVVMMMMMEMMMETMTMMMMMMIVQTKTRLSSDHLTVGGNDERNFTVVEVGEINLLLVDLLVYFTHRNFDAESLDGRLLQ